ncbi:MAG: adenylate kinase family protein [Candidatus Methanomethylicia archaeon]
MARKCIVISGCPGTGKTVVARKLSDILKLDYINLSELVLIEKLYRGYDVERGTYVVDLRKLYQKIREIIKVSSGIIIDSHYGDIIPSKYVKKIIVLRLHPIELKRRLMERGWGVEKIRENVEAELINLCTLNALDRHKGRVYEINVTGKSVDEVVREALNIVNNKVKPKEYVDWLSMLSRSDFTSLFQF